MIHSHRHRLVNRAAAGLALAACVGAAACSTRKAEERADTTHGIIDSVPGAVAPTVAALLSDQNVFAELDTTFGTLIHAERLAMERASDSALKAFAASDVGEHTLSRQGAVSLGQRLDISPVLPDKDALETQRKAIADISSKAGAAFDSAFVKQSIQLHELLLDTIDDALDGNPRRQEIQTFLEQLKANTKADLAKLKAMR